VDLLTRYFGRLMQNIFHLPMIRQQFKSKCPMEHLFTLPVQSFYTFLHYRLLFSSMSFLIMIFLPLYLVLVNCAITVVTLPSQMNYSPLHMALLLSVQAPNPLQIHCGMFHSRLFIHTIYLYLSAFPLPSLHPQFIPLPLQLPLFHLTNNSYSLYMLL
jgi:hypothetical protein